MKARRLPVAAFSALLVWSLVSHPAAAQMMRRGGNYRTKNFLVSAPSAALAKQIGDAAEYYRQQLASSWLGHELPRWSQPCPIRATVNPALGAGGATSFYFSQGRPHGWTMSIQGSQRRILDSVLPHEVLHTVFATHFGGPLPRWADEGACTTVEHAEEKQRQHEMLYEFLTTRRGIAFNRMFAMKEYPSDVLPLYSQGFSLARYLIAQGGRRKFVDFVGEGMKTGNWPTATRRYYQYDDLSDLQVTWLEWVRRGCPPVDRPAALAGAQTPAGRSQLGDRTRPARPASTQLTRVGGAADAGNQFAAVPANSSVIRSELRTRVGGQAKSGSREATSGLGWKSPPGGSRSPVGRSAASVASLTAANTSSANTSSANTSSANTANGTSSGTGSQASWYAQQADSQAATSPPHSAPAGSAPRAAVTRPRNAEQPGQVVIEWSRGGTQFTPGSTSKQQRR